MKTELLNFDRAELEAELSAELGLQPYRARQLMKWVHRRRSRDFGEMTDIAGSVRATLNERYNIFRPEIRSVEQSADGTRKYLMALTDGSLVETVLIKQPSRYTLCVSSQVGCAIGCRFCRTALMGLKRHLQTFEIVGQVLAVQDDAAALGIFQGDEGFRNIVFMGMGEPLHNLENVTRAVRILNDELGHNFSSRKITVSTSGLVPAIRRFGESGAPANLAVSLNATTDDVRDEIMPINKRWPLNELLGVLRDYPLKSRKRLTIEYVLLRGVNDTPADLARLPGLLRDIPCKVNLIPYNANTGLGFEPPTREVIQQWQDKLLQAGLNATIRWSKGDDIKAACGQLATDSARKTRAERAGASALPA